jgi:DNA-binding response OmpR family regulator
VARVVAFIPDLLFGSSVVGALSAAGHEPVLASNEEALRAALADANTGALIVDLTFDVPQRIELVRSVRPAGLKTLAFYSHVEAEVRDQGREAGFDLVIPRSRMAREGAAVLDRLLASTGEPDAAP